MTRDQQTEGFWLFGYGSLIWKPPPHYDKRLPGYITGYVRRFWQASEDHRGTPHFPGRVVTLIERSYWETLSDPQRHIESERVWGAAYHIIPSKVEEVKEYLDIREINGYSVQFTAFHAVDPHFKEIQCMVYIGMPDNPQFMGALAPQDVAERINQSVGPSGENWDYLLSLEQSLQELGAESGDAHVTDLARRVKDMQSKQLHLGREDGGALDLHKVNNVVEEQEEIEKEDEIAGARRLALSDG